MSATNKDISLAIIHFLKKAVSNNEISEEYAESMDVAIDCIADAFEVDKEEDNKAVQSVFKGKSLNELINVALKSETSKSDVKESVTSEAKESTETVSPEKREAADKLKLEGNKAMAAKDFKEAITKYSEAIEIIPNNEVYLSNRAAAYSQAGNYEKAIEDAETAIAANPSFAKAYSRLGLAKYASGDAKGAMEAYKKGLEIEGSNKSEAMQKGYETAKRRVEEDLEKSISTNSSEPSTTREAEGAAGAAAGAGGMPDFSSMFGGAGGMPNLNDLLSNPQVMQAAQSLMSNPGSLEGLMNNPQIREMAESFGMGGGNAPNMADLMNNPMLRNMANQFMGGANNGGNGNAGNQ